MGFGGGSSSGSSSQERDPDFPAIQKPFLERLWTQGEDAFQGTPGGQDYAFNAAAPGAQQGQIYAQQQGQLGQQFMGGFNPAQQALAQGVNYGQNAMNFNLAPQQQLLQMGGQGQTDQLVNQVGQDISQNLNENVLPGLRSQEVALGALGGSRGEIAAGQAAQGAQRAFGQQAADIRQSDLERRAATLGGLMDTTTAAQSGLTQGAMAYMQSQGTGSQIANTGAQNMINLGLAPAQAWWAPMQNYAAILNGSPQIGTVGVGSSQEDAFNFNISPLS